MIADVCAWQETANWILEMGPQRIELQQRLWLKEAEKEAEAREAAKFAEKEARKKTLAKCAHSLILSVMLAFGYVPCTESTLAESAFASAFLNNGAVLGLADSRCNRTALLRQQRGRESMQAMWSHGPQRTTRQPRKECATGMASLCLPVERSSLWRRLARTGTGALQGRCTLRGSEGKA